MGNLSIKLAVMTESPPGLCEANARVLVAAGAGAIADGAYKTDRRCVAMSPVRPLTNLPSPPGWSI